MRYTHYLITRFNVHEKAWTRVDKNNRPVCNKAWMEHRFELFDRYCAPSVAAQIRGFFTWIVIFHHKTAERWRNQITDNGSGLFTPLFVGHNWLRELQNYLNQQCSTRWLITTRLDNDDAISPWLIQQVQDRFDRQKFTFVDFPNGYRLKDGQLYARKEHFNPFISLIERVSARPKTVLSIPHGNQLGRNNKVIIPSHNRAWLQVVHERNKITNSIENDIPTKAIGWVRRYV